MVEITRVFKFYTTLLLLGFQICIGTCYNKCADGFQCVKTTLTWCVFVCVVLESNPKWNRRNCWEWSKLNCGSKAILKWGYTRPHQAITRYLTCKLLPDFTSSYHSNFLHHLLELVSELTLNCYLVCFGALSVWWKYIVSSWNNLIIEWENSEKKIKWRQAERIACSLSHIQHHLWKATLVPPVLLQPEGPWHPALIMYPHKKNS